MQHIPFSAIDEDEGMSSSRGPARVASLPETRAIAVITQRKKVRKAVFLIT